MLCTRPHSVAGAAPFKGALSFQLSRRSTAARRGGILGAGKNWAVPGREGREVLNGKHRFLPALALAMLLGDPINLVARLRSTVGLAGARWPGRASGQPLAPAAGAPSIGARRLPETKRHPCRFRPRPRRYAVRLGQVLIHTSLRASVTAASLAKATCRKPYFAR